MHLRNLIAVAIAVLAPCAALAASNDYMFDSEFVIRNAPLIGLPKERVDEIRNWSIDTRKKIVEADARRKTILLDLENALASEKSSPDQVNKLVKALADAEATVRTLTLSQAVRVRYALSADQLAKLNDLRAQAKSRAPRAAAARGAAAPR
jgi:hypothetical protein